MEINVFIEIPKGSRNKYEQDEKTGAVVLDRVLHGPEVFPFDYGSIEGTLGEDGDPLDVVVLVTNPTFPGCRAKAKVIGYLEMEDESGIDNKVLAVFPKKVDPRWAHVQDIKDLAEEQKKEIREFFENYKKLEPGKWVKLRDFKPREEAEKIVEEARARHAK
ncbi:MAG: inorganic diphosphatase [bacterium]|nr:inorganic diphosphatase [bacterium]